MKSLQFLVWILAALALAACNDNDNGAQATAPLATGLQFMQSSGVERTYYLLLPEDNSAASSPVAAQAVASRVATENPVATAARAAGAVPANAAVIDGDLKPLIIGFHGSFGSHRGWVGDGLPDFAGRTYDFIDVVGDDAIMVFPDALPLGEPPDQQINWNFEYDFLFFEDLLAELDRRGLVYDRDRVFVTGHSSGAGMTHEIACRYGDIVRGAAISSGSLISGGSCTGSVGIIQTQGEADLSVPLNVGAFARNFWVGYNGYQLDSTIPGVINQCVDYSAVAFPNENYPVQWCQHSGGHAWTDFNSVAFWTFLSGLPRVAPTADHPPGGGNKAGLGDADTTISFSLRYPADMGPVVGGAISLYPDDYEDGQFRAPSVFLNANWDPNQLAPAGQVTPGTVVNYPLVPITFFVFSGDFDVSRTYKLQISIYNEGGSRPIPTPGIDYKTIIPIRFIDKTTPVIINETLDAAPVVPW